jgi:hypothetical protein
MVGLPKAPKISGFQASLNVAHSLLNEYSGRVKMTHDFMEVKVFALHCNSNL